MIHPATDELIEFLDSLVKTNQSAMHALFAHRVPCNDQLAEHLTVQVTADSQVGFIGILNGFCGVIEEGTRMGWGPIIAAYDKESGMLIGFGRTPEEAPECIGGA